MGFTYTDRNKKIVLSAVGKTKVNLLDAVAVGDLLCAGATSATLGFRLADQSDSLAATLIALEDSVSGGEIEASFGAELQAPVTVSTGGTAEQTYFAATGDFLGSPLYLGESGKPASSAGATMVQEVGKLLARERIMLVPGSSVFGSAATFTTGTFTGAVAMSSTLDVAANAEVATLNVTGTATVSGAATFKSTVAVSGTTSLAGVVEISGATTVHSNLSVTGTLTVSGAATLGSSLAVSGALNAAGVVNISGKGTFNDEFQHVSEANVQVSAAKTLAVSDSGYRIEVTVTGITLTAPAITGTVPGLTYTIVNACSADALGDVKFSPVTQDKIFGCGVSGSTNQSLINTQATAAMGDLLQVVGNATTGWFIQRKYGTWDTT